LNSPFAPSIAPGAVSSLLLAAPFPKC